MRKKITAAFAVAMLTTLLVPAPAHAGRVVKIRGGGWGHGLGMSQYGAYGRALNGHDADRILKHYYTGISVSQRDMPKRVRVGLLQGRSSLTTTSSAYSDGGGKVVWKEKGKAAPISSGGSSVTWSVQVSPTGGMRLYKDGEQVSVDGRRVFGSPERPLMLVYQRYGTLVTVKEKSNSYAYGKLEFDTYPTERCGANYCLRLVVAPTMQQYLYGLAEVPASWPMAVLQAQTIAARTYAFSRISRLGQHREPCDCALYDSPIDQVYAGNARKKYAGSYWDEWVAAVDGTKGVVALHNGDPIQALYSSSSGGHTENNENVWGTGTPAEAIPYLRGVRDRADRAQGHNPNYTWSLQMSFSEFEAKLQDAYPGLGNLADFDVVAPRGVSGRVSTVRPDGSGGARIIGSSKTVRASGWDLRSALDLKDSLFYVDIQYEVGERLQARYRSLGGAPGDAVSAVYDVPQEWKTARGRAQNFQKGRMTWVAEPDKVVWQWGKVLRKYNRLGREKSWLGMPLSDVWGPGRYRGGTYQRGVITWSKDTGAHTIRGVFLKAFRRTGGPKGKLGIASTERHGHKSLPDKGQRQRFLNGTVFKRPDGQAFALWGAIDEKYRSMGSARSRCGYPRADMVSEDKQAAAAFRYGVITWNADDGVTVNCG